MRRTPVRPTPTHTELRQSVCRYLELQGAYQLPICGGLGQRRGSPDVLACVRGRFVACECKRGRDTLRPEQREQRAWIERAGGIWVEVRSLDDLQAALEGAGIALMGRLT